MEISTVILIFFLKSMITIQKKTRPIQQLVPIRLRNLLKNETRLALFTCAIKIVALNCITYALGCIERGLKWNYEWNETSQIKGRRTSRFCWKMKLFIWYAITPLHLFKYSVIVFISCSSWTLRLCMMCNTLCIEYDP